MLIIAGTVPIPDLQLTFGSARLEEDVLIVKDSRIPCGQGTAAMISAAFQTTNHLGIDPPFALIAGDIGDGRGSREIYKKIVQLLKNSCPKVLALHYIQPIMGLMKNIVKTVSKCPNPPLLLADAGSMYAAKAAGLSQSFDIFTPDAAEMAFLADPEAMHPAYISNYFFDASRGRIPELIENAFRYGNAPKALIIKGSKDYIVRNGEVIDVIDEPDVPNLEAVGGTGDTITGMVAALMYADLELHEAAIIASRANRMAGKYATVKPDTKISQIIKYFKPVFKDHLCAWSGVCMIPEGG